MNMSASLSAGLDATLAAQGHDIDVRLLRQVPRDALVKRAAVVPGVTGVEAWGMVLVNIEHPGGGASAAGTGRYAVFAPPPDTQFLKVPVVAGRWPKPGEADAVVVNRTLSDTESIVRLDAEITLMTDAKRRTVRVVGLVEELAPPALYTTEATLATLTGRPDAAGALRVTTAPGADRTVAASLEDVLADQGAMPVLLMTRDEFRASLLDHFQVISVCLLAAGAAAIAVGGLSVMTSMGINVLERSREIGVARSLGATRRSVYRMLLTEGIALAVLSAAVGVLLALPASAVLTKLIGDIGPHVTLPVVVSPLAAGWWAVIAAGITLTACLLAARRAVSLPVQEVLAYE
jgi:putative ABC transport system permease protein